MKKYLILIVSIQMILLTFIWALPGFAATEKELFEKGVALLKAEKYQQAVETFTKVIEILPNAADAYKNRGVAYMKQKRYDLAVADFLKTLEIQPELKGIYSNMGVARYYQRDYAKAIENYNQELEKSPGSYFTYFNRAICWSELKQYDKSLADVNKTLEIVPDLYPAICMKGDLYVKMGQMDKAKQSYEQAIEVSPDQTYAKTRMAELQQADSRARVASQTPPAAEAASKEPSDQGSPGVMAMPSSPKPAAPPATVAAKTVQPRPDQGGNVSGQTGTGRVYELQTGAYRVEENARATLEKLKEMGIDSRIVVASSSDGKSWYMVRAGSYPTYASAKEAKTSFKEKTGMDTVVKSAINQ